MMNPIQMNIGALAFLIVLEELHLSNGGGQFDGSLDST